jgi:cell division protein FtsB
VGIEAHQNTQDREIASVKAENQKLKQENASKANEMAELKARLDKLEKALTTK